MIVFIDGDIIRYSVGFAAEGDPVANCLHSVKQMIHNMCNQTHSAEYEIFLTGKGNYRETVSITQTYKGNRENSTRPTHYDAITEYLINVHGAEVIEGKEADDALGYNQVKTMETVGTDESCIATIDKDLDMIPGWHYNWKKDKVYFVTPNEAGKFFYKQLLTGDATDNILGCGIKRDFVYQSGTKKGTVGRKRYGVGPKEADQIIDMADDEEDLYWLVLEKYAEIFDRPYEVLEEMAHLLWIQRYEDVRWEPKW